MTSNPKTVDEYLNECSYGDDDKYVPSEFALKFVNFIKLVNGPEGESNKTPVRHYKMLDKTVANSGKDLINLVHRGAAKLQSGSSKVLTPTGWVTMRALQQGQQVINRYGQPTTVVHKTAPKYPRMFKMTLSDGTVLEVGDEHNHIVVWKKRVNGKSVVSEKVFTTLEMLDYGLTFTGATRKTSKDPKAQYRFRIPLTDPIQFSTKQLPMDPYIIGLMIANGHYKGGSLSCHTDDLQELLGYVNPIGSVHSYGNASRMYVGKDMLNWLGDITSRNKSIPEICLLGDVNQRTQLLRGLMDGDGTISKNGSSRYSTYSEALAKDVVSLVQSLGGIATVSSYPKANGGVEYVVRVQLKTNPFRLKRKSSKWKPSVKLTRPIVSIEEFECKEEGYCIKVASPCESYITEGYTVTHNTTLLGEYLFLYLAVFGELDGFGEVPFAIYVSDSIDNGVKNMRKNLEFRRQNSEFLMEWIPEAKFNDITWEFTNKVGNKFIVKGYGGKTGVRGAKALGKRPVLAVLDDLISDEDARSPTVIAGIEDTIYKAIDYALDPTKRKVIWSGTPFNAKDPLYKAVESGAWEVNVYPVCETFPCTRAEFRGSWEDRFSYDYVKAQYDKAKASGKLDTFNQELMLRIMSEDDKIIFENEIQWYSRRDLITRRGQYNFYITTDFATSEKTSADFSVISVWAINNKGHWFYVDGICRRQLMDKNVDDLFRLVQEYAPQEVGIEVTGQQGGFIPWLQSEMMKRNIFFNLSSGTNGGQAGIRPTSQKFTRFLTVVPWFKQRIMFFPREMENEPPLIEGLNELRLLSKGGFKSKHDDFCSSGDTLIKVKDTDGTINKVRFGSLKDGDMVQGFNESTGLIEWVAVKGFMRTGTKLTFTINDHVDNSIHVTENHPVLTQRGWVTVGNLKIGDSLVCRSKDTVIRGLKRKVGITSLRVISLMERGIGYIKKFIRGK